jgi:hypothetical protein
MPEKETVVRARRDAREGKSPSTQAGEFVREEMHHIRQGKHGARSTKQAIAIALSKARRSGVKLSAPKKGEASSATRAKAQQDMRTGRSAGRRKPSSRRSRATLGALKREGRAAASTKSLSRQTRSAARQQSGASRRQAALKAVRTKGTSGMKRAASKAAATRIRKKAA